MAKPGSIHASVVFLKMQDFARRPVTEQARLRAQLEAVLAVTTAELDPASRVVLDASDGAAVVVLRDPARALRLAELALAAGAAGLPLSVGINHGAVQLAADGKNAGKSGKSGGKSASKGGDGMVGDGIAVAASTAELAPASRLLVSRAFRDALADVAPGEEAALVPAGTFTDRGLRTHELYRPDRQAARRRRGRYLALSAVAAIAIVGAGVAARVAEEGRENFVYGVVTKYRDTAAQGQRYVRGLVEKVRF